MTTFGIDYAFGRPSVAAIHAVGARFVCRYLSHSPSKNLTSAEAHALSDAGIWIVVVWETTAKRALDGRTAGIADALDAQQQAQACGMPAGRPIYFAVDWDASKTQQAAIDAYLDGAASVLGAERVGIYGGYGPVSRAMSGGHAAWGWQTYAWSGGRWYGDAQLQQYSNDHTVDGVGSDYDRATTDDYGQWRVGVSPSSTHLEEAMPYGGQVPSRENVPNGYAVGEFSFPNEFADTVGLVSDHSYVNADAGYEAQPPAQVRVTAHRKGRKGEALKDPTKASPTYNTEVITVGAADGKGWPDKVVVKVKDPKDIDYITVVRLDNGKRPVGVDMS